MPARRLRITGFVQGVFFRAEAQQKAQELGLTGWVRNLDDDSVEIHAEGSEKQLKELEQWCWKGPPAAQVENVTVTAAENERHSRFEIR